ncbi:MAG: YIP1 family protein [Candidatus Aquicultor sp.]
MRKRLKESFWFSTWTQPRATIRNVHELKPLYWVPIIALASINASLNDFKIQSGDLTPMWSSIGTSLVIGIPLTLVMFYIQVALLEFTGRSLGGKATYERIQTAVALSRIPIVWVLSVWVAKLALFGEKAFRQGSMPQGSFFNNAIVFFNPLNSTPSEVSWFGVLGVISAIISVWAFIILLNCLSEVQEFSTGTALINVVVAFILPPILIILLLLPFLAVARSG